MEPRRLQGEALWARDVYGADKGQMNAQPQGAAALSRTKTLPVYLAFPFPSLCRIASACGGRSPNYFCLSATNSP